MPVKRFMRIKHWCVISCFNGYILGQRKCVDTFVCEIKQFPTAINPDSAEFEKSVSHAALISVNTHHIKNPQFVWSSTGASKLVSCFILLSLIKVDNLKVNWKEFLESNGTLDVTCI
ncbi:hypothetical protein OSTOST_19659 [Ostertagia ostertagi]